MSVVLNQTHPYNFVFNGQGDIRVIAPTGNSVVIQQDALFLSFAHSNNFNFSCIAFVSIIGYYDFRA